MEEKNSNKDNSIKTILILILIVLIVGVLIYGFTVWQNYQKEETKIENTKKFVEDTLSYTDSFIEDQQEYFEVQQKCSELARDYSKNSKYKSDDPMLIFYDYFNRELNKCFILISGGWGEATSNIELAEVYENKIYGTYSSKNNKIITCSVLDKNCTSKDEFINLLEPYMPHVDMLVL